MLDVETVNKKDNSTHTRKSIRLFLFSFSSVVNEVSERDKGERLNEEDSSS